MTKFYFTEIQSFARGVGGGGTLIFLYIRRLGLIVLVQSFEFQYFLGVSEKNNIFAGYEDFVDIF